MAAVATLYNPALYSNTTPDTISLAHEYIDYCVKYPAKAKMMRAHLCKLLKKQCVASSHLGSPFLLLSVFEALSLHLQSWFLIEASWLLHQIAFPFCHLAFIMLTDPSCLFGQIRSA